MILIIFTRLEKSKRNCTLHRKRNRTSSRLAYSSALQLLHLQQNCRISCRVSASNPLIKPVKVRYDSFSSSFHKLEISSPGLFLFSESTLSSGFLSLSTALPSQHSYPQFKTKQYYCFPAPVLNEECGRRPLQRARNAQVTKTCSNRVYDNESPA